MPLTQKSDDFELIFCFNNLFNCFTYGFHFYVEKALRNNCSKAHLGDIAGSFLGHNKYCKEVSNTIFLILRVHTKLIFLHYTVA